MNYSRIIRINRCGFTRATVARIIELHIYCKHPCRSIARMFGCSDKTINLYINKYYYGKVKRNHKSVLITLPSKLNDMERKEAAA